MALLSLCLQSICNTLLVIWEFPASGSFLSALGSVRIPPSLCCQVVSPKVLVRVNVYWCCQPTVLQTTIPWIHFRPLLGTCMFLVEPTAGTTAGSPHCCWMSGPSSLSVVTSCGSRVPWSHWRVWGYETRFLGFFYPHF